MEQHEYLSQAWIEAVRAVRAEYASTHERLEPLIVNYTLTGVPGHDGEARFHADIHSPAYYEPGHHPDAVWSITTDWATAREMNRDTSWGFERFTEAIESGELTIDGDAEAIRDAWAEAVRARGYVEMLDRIAAFTV